MISLYPYQATLIDEARILLRTHDSIIIQSPTGSGKTVLSATMTGNASAKGKRTFFICHRIELLEQTSRTFKEVGIPHGFIAAGFRPDPYQMVQICSIDTLKARLGRVYAPDFCIWDECHHVAAKGWAKVKDSYPNAKHVGLSATPIRMSGEGLIDHFKAMVQGPTVQWLIENGYLSDYKAYAPSTPDLKGVHKRMGDYAKGELATAMDKSALIGNAITHYLRLAKGKRAVAFCVNVKHSQHVAAQFRQAGIAATHIDGKMSKRERKAAIDGFRSGEIEVITNCEIITEGFDLPAMEVAIILRPTQSLSLHLQICGRPLRIAEGKDYATILDHAGNLMTHGLPDDEREWSLKGRKGRGSKNSEPDINIRQCPKCFHVHRPAPVCPKCGHVYIVETKLPEHVEGELKEVDKIKMRRKRSYEESKCVTYEDFVKLGKERGYHANAWARIRMAKRRGR